MVFEFANNVFSGMLSLFAAVIGLTYPFILDVVERIRCHYVTEKVVDWFQQESVTRHFFTLLRINIPIAILVPFALLLFDECYNVTITLLTFQSVFVSALLTYLIRVYNLVNIYGSYLEMAKHTKPKDMVRMAIVMLSADNKNEAEGYKLSRDRLYESMTKILVGVARRQDGSITELPNEVFQIISQILSAAENQRQYPRTASDTTPISLLYDAIYNKVHPTEELRTFIWRHLNMMLKAGNTEWLKSYWEWATQYYRSMYFDNSFKNEERFGFLELHLFFAAMAFRCKNRALIKHIMTYRDSSFETACMLTTNFKYAIENILKYDEQSRWPFRLVKPYQMYFISNDINADRNIFRVLCDYYAFSLLCMEKQNGLEVFKNDSYEITEDMSKETLEHNIQVIGWFREGVLQSVYNANRKVFTKEQYGAVDAKLVKTIEVHTRKIDEIKNNDNISQEKLKAMQDELIAINKKSKLPLIKKKMEGQDVELMEFVANVKAEASPGQLMEHQHINSVNFSDVLIAYLRNQFYRRLSSIFLLNGSVKTYLIQYKDICQALKHIGFNEGKYVLLNNGVSLWKYDLGDSMKSDIIAIGSGNNNLFVVKREDCPTYMYGDIKNGAGYQELDKDNGLYWIEPTKENGLTVQVEQPFIIYNRRHTRYIKINITYDRALGDCDLQKLKEIKYYL